MLPDRAVAVLRALEAAPGGLSASDLADMFAADFPSRRHALVRCGNLMRQQEAKGRVRLAGAAAVRYTEAFVWQVTDAGRVFLAECEAAGRLDAACLRVMGDLGRPAPAPEIARRIGDVPYRAVYDALRRGSRGRPPLYAQGPASGWWRLTEHGRMAGVKDAVPQG